MITERDETIKEILKYINKCRQELQEGIDHAPKDETMSKHDQDVTVAYFKGQKDAFQRAGEFIFNM